MVSAGLVGTPPRKSAPIRRFLCRSSHQRVDVLVTLAAFLLGFRFPFVRLDCFRGCARSRGPLVDSAFLLFRFGLIDWSSEFDLAKFATLEVTVPKAAPIVRATLISRLSLVLSWPLFLLGRGFNTKLNHPGRLLQPMNLSLQRRTLCGEFFLPPP